MSDALARHTDYGQTPLVESDVNPDPFVQLMRWLQDAERAGVYEPNAMVLSTIDPDGTPSSRTVLLRDVSDGHLEFFSNYESAKGRALAAHPEVSIVFPWYTIHRQVIVRGSTRRASAEASDAYFASRPRGSQVASAASDQSRPIADRAALESRVAEFEERYADGPVPRPEHWGGYLVSPASFEFWQGRSSRMHDRLLFTRENEAWTLRRLQP
ncbi:pyridoxamine 5'-phosphate oxidase [Microbacteriaceae bacterium SG_E_30_P1]|uniref:Pyridoxine/pyridoxamine 5'-phosphate oxidase n=1 Tax=Antiquaquibacter oligotrophicus TaxID=2880260 RepID=A0ABT6KL53_9MICO|nr:pyridoxamine 5'-phosphate oxidase [Antiquaquibacter oligotrophicus]MDH6180188.1 pyridoxamine 5'-phosphate oxidase [Antiquaquibacter oligotrophicus]UDF14062.1 pyridoxamine 5'-phosphate oxidase [Antiquaquibacter oligotrophicus]